MNEDQRDAAAGNNAGLGALGRVISHEDTSIRRRNATQSQTTRRTRWAYY